MIIRNNKDIKKIFFDLDGTLIDHFQTIYECYRYAQEALGLPPKDFETVKTTVGGSLEESMVLLVGKEHAVKACELFRKHFDVIMHDNVVLLPGSQWLLENLYQHGYRISLFTNKPTVAASALCKRFGFDVWLENIFGTQVNGYYKPQKEFGQWALKTSALAAHEAILIGDSIYDIQAGASVGMQVHAVATGSHSIEYLEKHEPQPHTTHADLYALGAGLFGFQEKTNKSYLNSL